MARFRHVIEVPGDGLPGHLARTLCGRVVAYARQPNVPSGSPRDCRRCRDRYLAEWDEPRTGRAAHQGRI